MLLKKGYEMLEQKVQDCVILEKARFTSAENGVNGEVAAQELSYDQWVEKYKPIQNILDDNASYDGCMHETYGAELEAARLATRRNCCWTVIECDNPAYDSEAAEAAEKAGAEYDVRDSVWVIASGFHPVNRLGYLITEVPFEGDYLEVLDDF